MAERQLLYSRIVIICREGRSEITPFKPGDEKDAEEYFDIASANWSDSYLCIVEKGPAV